MTDRTPPRRTGQQHVPAADHQPPDHLAAPGHRRRAKGITVTEAEIDAVIAQAADGGPRPRVRGAARGPVRRAPGRARGLRATTSSSARSSASSSPRAATDRPAAAADAYLGQLADEVGVTVSPRYGHWNAETAAIDGDLNDLSVAAPSASPEPSPTAVASAPWHRLVVLQTSPRVAPGLLTAAAWRLLARAAVVLAAPGPRPDARARRSRTSRSSPSRSSTPRRWPTSHGPCRRRGRHRGLARAGPSGDAGRCWPRLDRPHGSTSWSARSTCPGPGCSTWSP